MGIKSLSKIPKRKVTVDEILDEDGINFVLNEVNKNKGKCQIVMALWIDEEGIIHFPYSHGNPPLLIYMMETAKQFVMKGDI